MIYILCVFSPLTKLVLYSIPTKDGGRPAFPRTTGRGQLPDRPGAAARCVLGGRLRATGQCLGDVRRRQRESGAIRGPSELRTGQMRVGVRQRLGFGSGASGLGVLFFSRRMLFPSICSVLRLDHSAWSGSSRELNSGV